MTQPPHDDVDAAAARFRAPEPLTGGCVGRGLVGLSALLVAVPWAAYLAGQVFAVPPWPAIVVLTVLPHLALALLVLLFALWTLLPDRWEPPVLFLLIALPTALRWGPSWPAFPADLPQASTPLHVATWNVRRLWGAEGDGGDPTACVVDAVRALHLDALVLEEVTAADVAALTEPLGLRCHHTVYRTGDKPTAAGLAVCTLGPGWSLGPADTRTYGVPEGQGEDWQYIEASLDHGPTRVQLFGTHLAPHRLLHDPWGSWSTTWVRGPDTVALQHHQAAHLLARVQATDGPVLLAGDFNAAPDVPLHDRFRATLTDAWRRAGTGLAATVDVLGWLPLRIDVVYAGPTVQVLQAAVPDVACSDHRPVVATLAIPPR